MKKIIYILLLLTLVIPTSCEKMPNEVVDDFNLGINSDFLEYTLVVEFIDAANPQNPPQDIELQILDNENNGLLDSEGEVEFSVDAGIASFILNPNSKPNGPEDVKSFNLYAEAPGFLPVNFQVDFTENSKDQNLTISMVNTETPPSGVGSSIENLNLSNGTLNNSATIEIPVSDEKITGAAIKLEPGTIFYDANGNQIFGESLNINFTHFDASGDTSLSAFPGGFTPESVIGENGEEENIYFVTAGFASIDMDIDGINVKEFSKPIKVTMEVDSNGFNLDTDADIKIGDQIPVWSYEVESGTWVYEKTGTVVSNNVKMEVSFETDHLTWYNLDFYSYTCYRSNAITVNAPGSSMGSYFYTELVYAYNNQPVGYYARKRMYLYDGAQINYLRVPNNIPMKVRIFNGSNWYNKGNLITETEPFIICTESATINLPSSAFPQLVSAEVTIECPNSNFEFKPSYWFYYREKGARWWNYGYMHSGKFQTYRMKTGTTYEFRTYFGGWVTTEYTLTNNENFIDIISNEICNFAL